MLLKKLTFNGGVMSNKDIMVFVRAKLKGNWGLVI